MWANFHFFFTVKLKKDVWRMLELNYHLPTTLLPHNVAKCSLRVQLTLARIIRLVSAASVS